MMKLMMKMSASKEITINELEKNFHIAWKLIWKLGTVENVQEHVFKMDSNVERGMVVCCNMKKQFECYRKMLEDKKKATIKQTKLEQFFVKK